MKLRLNVSNELLGFMFNVRQSTVSRIFLNTLDILHVIAQLLMIWPGRSDPKKTMLMEIRRYLESKVVVIVDCFEVFIEIPSNLEARSLTSSSYTHHTTVKSSLDSYHNGPFPSFPCRELGLSESVTSTLLNIVVFSTISSQVTL